MTTLQKIHDCIDRTDYAQYFVLMRKAVGKNNLLATLEQEYISGQYKADLPQRMRVLADNLLTALPTAHKFLTDFLKPTDFVGRQAELEQLHALLEAGEASVIVNGLGGVGKTTLARQYVQLYKENYHNIVWLEQQNTLLSALITNERLTDNMHFTTETEEERFKRVMRELENTEGKNLLVIDNYEQKDADDKIDVLERFRNVQFNHWRVLFTSREQVRRFKSIDLSFLPTHEAIELFTLHCENKAFDEKTLELLLEEVGKHTLTIELLAKTYSNNFDIERLEDLLTVLQQKEYDHALLQELIDTEHHKGYEPLYKHLLLLFDMEHWTDEERYILKQFAVLPSLPIKAKQLLDWLQDEKRVYKNILQNLARKGWLSTKDQQQYEMHRLLKVLIQKHLGVMWEDVKIMVESVKEELAEEKVEAKPLASQWFIEYAKGFLENISYQDNEVEKGYVWFRLGCIYHFTAFYDNAEQCYEKALVIVKKYKGILHIEYIKVLNYLGFTLCLKNNYEDAITIYQESLKIQKKILKTKHIENATSLQGLANVYSGQGRYNEAIVLYQKALQIRKEILGEKHNRYATSLHNIAVVYDKQKKYEEAIFLHQEALQICKEVLGEKHPNYAISLHNLANVYDNQGKYEKAIPLYQEALQINKEVLGEKHPYYANSLHSLASVYCNQEKYEEAISLYKEALQIRKEVLGEENSYTINTKEWLEYTQTALQNKTNTEL